MTETKREVLNGHLPIAATQAAGGGCLIIFALPFIAVGLFVIAISRGFIPLKNATTNPDAPLWILTAIGSVFAFAGLALAWSGVKNTIAERAAKRRRDEHPTEPWHWDHDWDTKGVSHGGLGAALQTFVVFLFLAVFLAPFNWWAFFSNDGPIPVKLGVGLFDLVALLILAGAFYGLFQYLKYGRSRLHFARFPFRPGASVEAGLEAGRRLAAAPVIVLALRYIEEIVTVTGSGKNRNTTTTLYCLHEVKQELRAGSFDATSGAEIPIRMRLPEGEFSNRLRDSPRRYWQLQVTADTPGIDYDARFLLPVYGADALKPRPETDWDAIDADES